MLLQDLLTESNELGIRRRNPPLKHHPEIRKIGAEIVKYFLKNIGRGKLVKWEVDERGIVRLYLPVLHNNPQHSRGQQPLVQLIRASEKFNVPFRMFGDGNLICVEMEVKV